MTPPARRSMSIHQLKFKPVCAAKFLISVHYIRKDLNDLAEILFAERSPARRGMLPGQLDRPFNVSTQTIPKGVEVPAVVWTEIHDPGHRFMEVLF